MFSFGVNANSKLPPCLAVILINLGSRIHCTLTTSSSALTEIAVLFTNYWHLLQLCYNFDHF